MKPGPFPLTLSLSLGKCVCVCACECVCVCACAAQNVSLWRWMAEVLLLGRRRHFLTKSRSKAKQRHQERSPPRSPDYSLTCASCKLQGGREGQLYAQTLWNSSLLGDFPLLRSSSYSLRGSGKAGAATTGPHRGTPPGSVQRGWGKGLWNDRGPAG